MSFLYALIIMQDGNPCDFFGLPWTGPEGGKPRSGASVPKLTTILRRLREGLVRTN